MQRTTHGQSAWGGTLWEQNDVKESWARVMFCVFTSLPAREFRQIDRVLVPEHKEGLDAGTRKSECWSDYTPLLTETDDQTLATQSTWNSGLDQNYTLNLATQSTWNSGLDQNYTLTLATQSMRISGLDQNYTLTLATRSMRNGGLDQNYALILALKDIRVSWHNCTVDEQSGRGGAEGSWPHGYGTIERLARDRKSWRSVLAALNSGRRNGLKQLAVVEIALPTWRPWVRNKIWCAPSVWTFSTTPTSFPATTRSATSASGPRRPSATIPTTWRAPGVTPKCASLKKSSSNSPLSPYRTRWRRWLRPFRARSIRARSRLSCAVTVPCSSAGSASRKRTADTQCTRCWTIHLPPRWSWCTASAEWLCANGAFGALLTRFARPRSSCVKRNAPWTASSANGRRVCCTGSRPPASSRWWRWRIAARSWSPRCTRTSSLWLKNSRPSTRSKRAWRVPPKGPSARTPLWGRAARNACWS